MSAPGPGADSSGPAAPGLRHNDAAGVPGDRVETGFDPAEELRQRSASKEGGDRADPGSWNALDQLEYEDRTLRKLLDTFAERHGDRVEHGVVGKVLIEHLAVRLAAREAIVRALGDSSRPEVDGLRRNTMENREVLAHLEEMARGVQPINLNQGQDFDAAVAEHAEQMRRQIDQELNEALPALRRDGEGRLRSGSYVRHHAPTHPNPHHRRWYERVPPLVRLHAIYDRYRGFPTGGAKPSEETDAAREVRAGEHEA